MARGKKKKELSLEEKLERALVPVEEQSYEVPGNWCWTRFEYVAVGFQYGCTEKATYENVGSKYIRITDIGNGRIDEENAPYCKIDGDILYKYLINKNDILIARMGSVGETGFAKMDMNAVFASYLIRLKPKIEALYMKYFLQSEYYWLQISNKSQGTTRLNVNANVLRSICIPLPPLREQQRIVEKIEHLFSKLDEVREKLQVIIQSSEVRKSAILQRAVSGEFTRKWRNEKGVSKEGWKTISLKECGIWFGGGTPSTSKKEFWDGGTIPWITSKDMKEREIRDSLLHITQEGVDNSSANYCDRSAILFVMRSGILRRVFPVCMVNIPFTVNQDLKAVIPEKISQKYLYWVCTAYEKDIRDKCMKSGTTVESIETKRLFSYEIPLPSDEEQYLIVDVIEKIMTKEESAKELAQRVIDKVEIMKKSILVKAFRGQLGTNDPEEESSVELLKRILEKAI